MKSEQALLLKIAHEFRLSKEDTLMLLAMREAENGAGLEKQKILDIKENMVYTLTKKEIKKWIQEYVPDANKKNLYQIFTGTIVEITGDMIAKNVIKQRLKTGQQKIKILFVSDDKEIIKSIENVFLKKNKDITKNIKRCIRQEVGNGGKLIPNRNILERKKDTWKKEEFLLSGSNGKKDLNVKNVDMLKTSAPFNGIIKTHTKRNFGLKLQALHLITITDLLQNLENVDCCVLIVISKNIIHNLIETNLSGLEYYQIELWNDLKEGEFSFYKDLGYEFGVLAAKGTDLEEQARWAAVSIEANRIRYRQLMQEGIYRGNQRAIAIVGSKAAIGYSKIYIVSPNIEFIEFMAHYGAPTGYGWCPIHAPNMSKKDIEKNSHWVNNVRSIMKKYEKLFKEKGVIVDE
jgi:hypothetical protein